MSSSFFLSLPSTWTTSTSPISVAWPITSTCNITGKNKLDSRKLKECRKQKMINYDIPIKIFESRLPLRIAWKGVNVKNSSSFLKDELLTLELPMIDSLNLWLVGRYFPVAEVTEKFSRSLHSPTCNFFTRATKILLQVQWILTPCSNK